MFDNINTFVFGSKVRSFFYCNVSFYW